jgi:uncharacterized protein involved in response to NO
LTLPIGDRGVTLRLAENQTASRLHLRAVLGYGFRPFFLLAALYAPAAVLAWLLVLIGVLPDPDYMGGSLLHGHEMVFGFVVAGVLGFLTTALPNFAGAAPITGRPLALLAGAWLAGRLALRAADLLPPVLVAGADLALVPVALVLLLRSLPRPMNRRMFVFLGLFAVFGAANALTHVEALGWTRDTATVGVILGIDATAVLIALIGGRIIPAFTANALRAAGELRLPWSFPLLDAAAIGMTVTVALATLILGDGPIVGAAALLAGIANAVRLSFWRGWLTVRTPILFVLHVGYGWLAAALLLKAAAELGGTIPPSIAVHALTVGCFGTMMMAVMSRAALGHTGRPLVAHPLTVTAYVLVSSAALLRVAAGLLPDFQIAWLTAAAASWIAAFALFLTVYAPILLGPRADGRPG